MNRVTDIAISIIAIAIVTTVLIRPGASTTIKQITDYLSNAIKSLLGTET